MPRSKAMRGFARHRRWLIRCGLLGRPWLILGSAPAPVLPRSLPPDIVHAHVKYAGRSAARFGLPPADITWLLNKTTASEITGIELRHVLRLKNRLSPGERLARALGLIGGREYALTKEERDLAIVEVAGSLFGDLGRDSRPSGGVAFICYALAVGVPEIYVAGIALDRDGYEYAPAAQTRRHLAEDRAALKAIASRRHPVFTAEPSLIQLAGVRPALASEPGSA